MRWLFICLLIPTLATAQGFDIGLLAGGTPPSFSSYSPTNVAGGQEFWSVDDLTIGSTFTTWTGERYGITLNKISGHGTPIACGIGVLFTNTPDSVTNIGIPLVNPFSFGIQYTPNDSGADNNIRMLWCDGNVAAFNGLCLSNNYLFGIWNNSPVYSGTQLITNVPYVISYVNGTVYTNDVATPNTVGTPTGTFNFRSIGLDINSNICSGYMPYILPVQGTWGNSDITNFTYWCLHNNVTNVTSGLVHWWPFDESSGTAIDYGSSPLNATLNGSPTRVASIVSNGVSLNASTTNDWFQTSSGTITTNTSITFWSKSTQSTSVGGGGHQPPVIFNLNANGGWQAGMGENDTFRIFAVDSSGLHYSEALSRKANDGNWHFWCFQVSGTNLYTWQDGIQYPGPYGGTGMTSAYGTTGGPFYMGYNNNYFGVGGYKFAGTNDDIRVYNFILSEKDICRNLYRWRGEQ